MPLRFIKSVLVLGSAFVIIFTLQSCDNKESSAAEVRKRSFEITYNVKVNDVPKDSKEVKVWIPVPKDRKAQKLHYFRVGGDIPYTVLEEPKYGNNYIVFDLDETGISQLRSDGIQVVFAVTRYQNRPLDSSWRENQEESDERLKMYLAPNCLVPINGRIAAEARRVAGHMKGRFAQSKVLYEHVVKTVSYDKRGSGWGRGDALYACDVRKGNCTDFHSLFIGELRSLGIPARFVIGFAFPEDLNEGELDYHCWAQFYIDGKGWLPVDASQASNSPEKLADCFAVVDEHRVAFTVGRDIKLPGSSSEPVNFSIYPGVEIDGRTCRNPKTTVRFKVIDNPEEVRTGK